MFWKIEAVYKKMQKKRVDITIPLFKTDKLPSIKICAS
jgi:hypothetical protein